MVQLVTGSTWEIGYFTSSWARAAAFILAASRRQLSSWHRNGGLSVVYLWLNGKAAGYEPM